MRISTSRKVKMGAIAAVAASALVVPTTTGAASADTSSGYKATGISVNDIGQTCKKKTRKFIVRNYYRGPAKYVLRCGTKTWGWKHIKLRHGWNKTMDRKIGSTIWSGQSNSAGGFSTYTNQCPRIEKFRTILGSPAGATDLRTAYKVDRPGVAKC